MNNGLAIIEVNESETRSVFIDQDALECAKLNALTKKRIAQAEKAEREVARQQRRADKMAAKRKAYNAQTANYILGRCIVAVAATMAMCAGLIHPFVSVPVAAICLGAACVRFGTWLGRNADGKA